MTTLTTLLDDHRATLVRWFEQHARHLRRLEGADDLAQGVHLHALRYRDNFRYLGERPFVAWMLKLAKQYLAGRTAHWKALKRDAGPSCASRWPRAGSNRSAPTPVRSRSPRAASRCGSRRWRSTDCRRATASSSVFPARVRRSTRSRARSISLRQPHNARACAHSNASRRSMRSCVDSARATRPDPPKAPR